MPRTYDPREWFQDTSFPKGGVDLSDALYRQSARPDGEGGYSKTTRRGVNVRAESVPGSRSRGGQRVGLKRMVGAQVSGTDYCLQLLDTLYTTDDTVPQYSLSGRVIRLVAVADGTVYTAEPGGTAWTAATNNSGETPALAVSGVMFSAQNNQKLYFCDGINYCYYDPVTGSVENWSASAGGGTMPQDSANNVARLICTWRGRTVLSGLLLDPQNVFFSAVSAPRDWNYSPASPSAADAVALNLSDLGLIGEPVTCLVPISDDVLIVGCTNSIYAIRGDPLAGGQIDRITDSIGMVFGQPYTKAADGTVYFFSSRGGVFRMDPTSLGVPQKVSSPIDQHLVDLDTGENHVRMAWDDRFDTLQVFVTNLLAPAETYHYALETKAGAWWLDRLASVNFDPLCCCVLDGNEPGDRVVLIGSWDGYVRSFDPTAEDDDNLPIESEVWIGPFLTDNMDEILLKDLQAVLAEDSGDVTWAVHAGRSAEEAFASEAFTTGSWVAGRNEDESIRAAGHALYVKLTASAPWQLEQIRARVATMGKVRRRG